MNEILTANNVDVLRKMPDDSVDLTVTSPPYDNLRTYKGYSFDFEGLATELFRVTKTGGVLVWVVNDATINGSESGTSFRQALFFKETGFNLHDTMIFAKKSVGMYDPRNKRYKSAFEYMFVFSKGKPKTYNPIKDKPVKHVGHKRSHKPRSKTGDFRKEAIVVSENEFQDRFNIWEYSTGNPMSVDKSAFKHPAIFPEKLAEDHILSWSNPGDIILDPFGGSGTTAKMAKKNGRQFIHIDISEEYNEIARQRVAAVE